MVSLLIAAARDMVNKKTYAEDGQQDVEEQARVAAKLEEDAERGEDDGEDDLADVARREC
jgi:hypothetical protein